MDSKSDDYMDDSNLSLYSDNIKYNSKNPYSVYISTRSYTWEKDGEKVVDLLQH